MHKPILGVLGGVGPLATAYFMELVIKHTPAHSDQDNIPMIVFNDPQIPDRTAHILDPSAPDPVPEMAKVARWLERAGADYVAIPCNTAHYFYNQIADSVDIPVLNIMEETVRTVAAQCGPGASIGLLATDGTIDSGVYQQTLERAGLKTVVPDGEGRRKVMEIIYDGVKSNEPYDPEEFLSVARGLMDRGCSAVIVGCTELSVVYQDLAEKPLWMTDAMDVLADACVRYYEETRDKVEHEV